MLLTSLSYYARRMLLPLLIIIRPSRRIRGSSSHRRTRWSPPPPRAWPPLTMGRVVVVDVLILGSSIRYRLTRCSLGVDWLVD